MDYGLSDYTDGESNVKLGFVLYGDNTFNNYDGVLIDNVEVSGDELTPIRQASFGEIKALAR